MKKILVLLLVLSGISLAQYAPAKEDIKFPYYYTHMVNGEYLATMVYNVGAGSDASTPLYTTPYKPRIFSRDSLVNRDTVSYDFLNSYYKGYITVKNRSGVKTDTIAIDIVSDFSATTWTSAKLGSRDLLSDYIESSNALIIVPIATEKQYEINILRPSKVRVRTVNQSTRTLDVGFTGVN